MPELTDDGAEMIYRNSCVTIYFKTWIFLLKKIIYIDDLRILRDCPWEQSWEINLENKIVYNPPLIDLMGTRTFWPSFVTDDNFGEVFFDLKYLWEVHCNNNQYEIFRVGPGNLGIRARKQLKKKEFVSLNEHRNGLWMVHQDLDFEDLYVLALSGITSFVKNANGKYSFGWGLLYFANSPRDLSLPEDSELHVDSDLDFCNNNINKKNEKNKRPFIPFLPVYKGMPGDTDYIRSHSYTWETTIRGYHLISSNPDRRFKSEEEILVNYYPTIYPYQLYTLNDYHKPLVEPILKEMLNKICLPFEDEKYITSEKFLISIFVFIMGYDSMEDLVEDMICEFYESGSLDSHIIHNYFETDSDLSDDQKIGSGFGTNVKTVKSKSEAELQVEKLKKQLAEAERQLKLRNNNNNNNNNNSNNNNKNNKKRINDDLWSINDSDYEVKNSPKKSKNANYIQWGYFPSTQGSSKDKRPTIFDLTIDTDIQEDPIVPITVTVPIVPPVTVPDAPIVPPVTVPNVPIVIDKIQEMRAARLKAFEKK